MKAPKKPYNEESPIYHIRNLHAFMDYTRKNYPEVNQDEILEFAGISKHQYNDWGYWFNQRQADRFMEILVEKTGNNNIAREAGRYNIIKQNIIAQYVLGFQNISSLIVGLNKLYSKISIGAKAWAKRLGKYKLEMSAKPEPGVIEQPYQCLNRLGAIEGIIFFLVHQIPRIAHPECVHRGDEICRYIISWDKPAGFMRLKRLSGHSAVVGSLMSLLVFIYLPFIQFLVVALATVTTTLGFAYYSEKLENKKLDNIIKEQGESASDLMHEINVRFSTTELLQKIGRITLITQGDKQIATAITNAMESGLEFGRGTIMLADGSQKILSVVSIYGFSTDEKTILNDIQIRLDNSKNEGILMKVFKTQEAIIVEDLEEFSHTLDPQNPNISLILNIRSMICVPIVYQNESLGILTVDSMKAKRDFSQSDINLLMAIASQTAVSIANARSFHKLEESEKKHRTLVETIRDIVYTVDIEGRFTYVSPMVEIITGYSTSDMIGQKFEDVIIPSQHEAVRTNFEESLETETVSNYQVQIVSKEGKGIPVEINTTMLFDTHGQAIGRIGVARDITRRAQEEEKRKEMEIKALAQDKLASLGEIATGVSHEINQPLSYIKIILESTLNDLSNDRLDTTELNEDFQESLRQLGKITNIISHLRTFGRSDVTSFSPVSLPWVVEDTMILMQKRLQVKNIYINKDIAENLPMINGNHVVLEQVFINLLQNSMDALEDKGKGEIELRMSRDGSEVVVNYSDNGNGMSPEVREKIFEPFYTTKDVGQGTGIGLSIVYGIIQEHHGTITCESKKGQGATFEIRLPVYDNETAARLPETSNA